MERRFFVEKIGQQAILAGDEFSHAKNVLRLGVGDELVLFDGGGKEYTAVVAAIGKREMVCSVLGEKISDKEPKTQVRLLIGALKGDKTELVVQKATELGASSVGVFSSRYCAAYMNENKLARLQKVAVEAAKQCGRASVPQVEYFESFAKALASCAGYRNKLFACEFAQKSEADLSAIAGSTALIVGSEGGFTREEAEEARAAGFALLTLGRRILRAETAAVALTAVAMFALGELR